MSTSATDSEPVVVVGVATRQLVGAQVVATALDQREGRPPAEQGGDRVGEPRHVAVDDLGLEGQRRRRDDGRTAAVDGVEDGRDEVRERLAGARAGLDEEVLPGVDGPRHRVGHLDLPGPLDAPHAGHGRVEERVEGGHPSRVCRLPTREGMASAPGRRAPGAEPPSAAAGRSATMASVSLTDEPSPRFPTDLEIASAATLRPMSEVAAAIGLTDDDIEPFGRDVAKLDLSLLGRLAGRPQGKYVVVTAMTPTPLGEGKTTTSVGLAQGLAKLGHRPVVVLRQPSMGPTFGIKGGAAGGGYSQLVPMERFNLHLTGDFHAIAAAHNLLAAMIDNHLHFGNALDIDERNITWRRVVDINDRSLRDIVIGLGARIDGVPRQTGFDITAASEVMVLLTLATSLSDLRRRLGRIVIGYTRSGDAVTAEQLGAAGAMAVLLRDALKPNLLQTLEGGPALVHCGPFGNIATGTSSVIADLMAIRAGDIVVTEAGFGADMGAERFFNVKCRVSGLAPDAAVIVATVRALKAHSGRFDIKPGRPLPDDMLAENPGDVAAGIPNLRKQIQIVQRFGVTPVVAINAFPTDFASEYDVIRALCDKVGVRYAVSTHFTDGGDGALDLGRMVLDALDEPNSFDFLYTLDAPLAQKIETIAREIYGADGIDIAPAAAAALAEYERLGFGTLPVVIAKTHLSISSDPTRLGAPTGWRLPVREVRAAVGAGYVYAICGDMRMMPGLARHPNAERIDIDATGTTVGLS